MGPVVSAAGGHSDGGPSPRARAAGLPPQACTGQRAGHPQCPETLGPGDVLLGLPFILSTTGQKK